MQEVREQQAYACKVPVARILRPVPAGSISPWAQDSCVSSCAFRWLTAKEGGSIVVMCARTLAMLASVSRLHAAQGREGLV